MKPATATKNTGGLTVLSVSPLPEDHLSLQAIFGLSRWTLFCADRVASALPLLLQHEISVVACERDLRPGTWVDLLQHLESLPNPPALIVTSRVADEQLWAEALNLGGWDVLAKPFVRREVIHSVKLAWDHWHRQIQVAARPVRVLAVAG
jgi:DNA-binding response OmpR family regulator